MYYKNGWHVSRTLGFEGGALRNEGDGEVPPTHGWLYDRRTCPLAHCQHFNDDQSLGLSWMKQIDPLCRLVNRVFLYTENWIWAYASLDSVSHHHKKPRKKFQTYISIFDRLHHCFVLGSVLMGKGPKIGQKMTIFKNGLVTHPKSRKRLKSKAIPSFLGDVGLIKVVSEFSSGHPKCHFWARKDGHFCQKCP